MPEPAASSTGMSKNTKIILWVVVGVVVLTGIILGYIYWYKPTYIDNKTDAPAGSAAPPAPAVKKEINLNDGAVIKDLVAAGTPTEVLRVLKAA